MDRAGGYLTAFGSYIFLMGGSRSCLLIALDAALGLGYNSLGGPNDDDCATFQGRFMTDCCTSPMTTDYDVCKVCPDGVDIKKL
jgi:hypothetical protein